MPYDDPWLSMLEELYGKEYVERLLAEDEEPEKETDQKTHK